MTLKKKKNMTTKKKKKKMDLKHSLSISILIIERSLIKN